MKLVRDKIPEIIEADGKWCLCRTVHGKDELIAFLRNKMAEEMEEFVVDPCLEEAADVFEVFRELLSAHGLSVEDAMYEAARKRTERGGFSKGIILQRVGEKS
jgi:predicted house-cleaning noncanonical NTP pyrophosphatase (MazG superfamily)